MLPLNSKQVLQYKLLRFFYLTAMVACVATALYFCTLNSVELKICGLVGTIVSLCFLYVFRSLLFPPDIRTGFTITLGLILNYGIVVYLVPNGWMFGFFYIFYSIVCFQGLVVIIFLSLVFLRKEHNLPDFFNKGSFKNNKLILLGIVVFFAVPIFLTLYYFSQLFMDTVETAPFDQRFWIWLGFFLDLAQQGFIITKIIMAKGYHREINSQQYKLTHNWNQLTNFIFLAGLAVIVMRALF